jgi:hypothetical protein
MKIRDIKGEMIVYDLQSDAEACRWFLEVGRAGDWLDDTGELMSVVVKQVFGFEVEFDNNGRVRVPEGALT